MLDKNGFPLQFPPGAFAAFPGLGHGMGDPRATADWRHQLPPATAAASSGANVQGFGPTNGMVDSNALLGLPPNAHSLSPNYLSALHHSPSASLRLSAAAAVSGHQEYLNAAAQRLGELQASAGLVDPLHFEASRLAAASRATRKRALSASPYSEMDLANFIRHSPLNGSPSSSGSFGHMSPGTVSPALAFHPANAHLQQLQAHLLRSASSPYLPGGAANSFLHSPYFPLFTSAASIPSTTTTTATSSASRPPKMTPEQSSNVVSSTMEDDEAGLRGKSTPVRAPASICSTGDRDEVKEEPDFVETHCHWKECDREFGTQDELVKHLNNDHVGTNKKLFICQWQTCSRAEKPFKAQYMLVVHMRRHTGEKPHRCTFESCSKAYSRLENLKTHLRSHTGEKPYVCEFPGCSKAFSNASDRAKHQNRTHSNEKPYACRAPGCTKRYTDPSSLRKHVKTVHGADFYASKRHKGESYEDKSKPNPGDSSGKSRGKHSNQTGGQSGIKLENSPGSLSPPDARLPTSNPISDDCGAANDRGDICLPISDNNVSTTASDIMLEANEDWDIKETDDINMAVAAAIGVGSGGDLNEMGFDDNRIGNRIHPKAKMGKRSGTSATNSGSSALGEINRSIEKLSIGHMGPGGQTPINHAPKGTLLPVSKTATQPQVRRDSNWTNSTEGYGSMRSDHPSTQADSRRCSELSSMSQGSNLSTRAQMNSPWAQMSAASSRKSSMREGQSSTGQHGLSNQLDRLHRKARTLNAPALGTSQSLSVPHDTTGRQSAMSESGMSAATNQNNYGTPRRASDPVRTLDRNFGVRQMSKHKSTNHLDRGTNPQIGMATFSQTNPSMVGPSAQPPMQQFGGSQSQVRPQNNPGFPQTYPYPQSGSYAMNRSQYPQHHQQWSYQSGQHYSPNYYNQGQQPYNYSQWNQHGAQWNQGWDWNRGAQVGPNGGDSYQRTLEYVQQCQSWNGNCNNTPMNPNSGTS